MLKEDSNQSHAGTTLKGVDAWNILEIRVYLKIDLACWKYAGLLPSFLES
jgi:hypothetical protein